MIVLESCTSFQPSKTKANRTLRGFFFFRSVNKLQAIVSNSDCFLALFLLVVIGRVLTLVLI